MAAIGCSDAHVGLSESGGKNLVGAVVTAFSADSPEGIFQEIRELSTKAVAIDGLVKRKVAALMKGSFDNHKELSRWVVGY